MFEFDMEFDSNVVAVAAVFYIILLACVWYVPAAMGWQEYSLGMKITLTILGIPMCYFITNFIANK
jgi:hypothetical protein